MKFLALIFLSVLSVSAMAEDLSFKDRQFIKSYLDEQNIEKEIHHVINRYGLHNTYDTIQRISRSQYSEKYKNEINRALNVALMHSFPSFKQDLSEKKFNGLGKVYQNNILFDMERIPVQLPSFTVKQGKHFELIDSKRPIFENEIPYRTSYRMKNGLPAIGPDSKNIFVCQLLDMKGADFYEFERTSLMELIEKENLFFNPKKGCLDSEIYWKIRSGDF